MPLSIPLRKLVLSGTGCILSILLQTVRFKVPYTFFQVCTYTEKNCRELRNMALGAIFYKILKMAPAEMEKRVCDFSYSRFHKTFLKSSLQMHWI